MLYFVCVQHFIHDVLPAKFSITWHHMPASSTSHHAREDTMETRQATDHFKTSLIESCRVPLPAHRFSFRLTLPADPVRGSCTETAWIWMGCSVARTGGFHVIIHTHRHVDIRKHTRTTTGIRKLTAVAYPQADIISPPTRSGGRCSVH